MSEEAPAGAASALTQMLGVLRPHELEVYEYLDGLRVLEFAQKLGKSWWRPMDVGGFDGSHHSRTLAKLVKLGLAERRQRGSLAGIRSSWEYRALDTPNNRICVENPVGAIGTQIRPASQYIQPWHHGHNESKKTGLWLKNLPLLQPSAMLEGDGRTRRDNQTASGQNKLSPGPDRWKIRSATYAGIAAAFAAQWGPLL